MKLLVISSNYPSPQAPQVGTFVYKLMQEFVQLGTDITVIAPKKLSIIKKEQQHYGQELAKVYRPQKLTFSNKKIGPFNTYHLTNYFQARAIKKTVNNLNEDFSGVYCHFISSGLHYYQAFPKSKLPLFVAVGEYHNIDVIRKHYSKKYYGEFLNKVKGFIAVSPLVQEKLISLGVPATKILIAPNGTDLSKFKPRNKLELRKKYRLPLDKKIVLFVGRLLENKGPLRVEEALNQVSDDTVAVFIGKGPQQPTHSKIVFSGTVEHHTVAEYMSLADVFVLPTLHEGSSNVIIEAMASGLPIVSSDIPEIRVQCNPDYAVLVNPKVTNEIAAALNQLLNDDTLRGQMSQAALEASKQFDITQRAQRILAFIKRSRE